MPPVGLIKDIARRLCGGEILKRIVDDYRGTPYKVTQPSAAVLKQSLKQDGGDTRLRVLAYNLWAIPLVCPDIEDRVRGAIQEIQNNDVIFYQEAMHVRERELIIESAKARGLAYHYDFCYGIGLPLWPRAGGTGLLVISRFPIVDAKFKRYSCNGNPATIFHGDYLAAKGIGLVRLRVADGVTVDVFATHLHACYSPNWPPSFHTGDEYFDTRISQAFESARFIMNTWESALMVLCGDFNDERDSSVVQLQFDLIPGLRDSWVSLPQNRGKEGFTYDSGENPFANVDGCTERRRIDFMFYALMEGRQCEEKQSSTGGGQWSLVSCDVAKHKSLSKTMDVSDHYGMRAEFRLVQGMDWLPKNTTKLAKEAKAFDAQYAAALASVCEMMELGKKRMTTARTKALKFSGMVFMAWLLCIGLIYSELVSHLPSVSVFQICTNSMLVAIISVLCVLVGGTFFILGHFTFKEDINSMTALLSEANIMLEAHKRYK